MVPGPLTDRIVADFDAMPAQLKAAALYVLERPSDVALLSMREQARQAGVQPATMTRLAKRLGFAGYDTVRELYAGAIRDGGLGFVGKAGAQVVQQQAIGDTALAADMIAAVTAQIGRLQSPQVLEDLSAAARLLAEADRVYCLGLRSSHPVAWHLYYVLSLLGGRAVLLDGAAGTGVDALGNAGSNDVLCAVSVAPYTRATVEAAQGAHARGVPIVAVTDSPLSPLARLAQRTVLVSTTSPSFFHTMAPAFVVGEILAAIVAGRGGARSLEALHRTEAHLADFRVHWSPRDDRELP